MEENIYYLGFFFGVLGIINIVAVLAIDPNLPTVLTSLQFLTGIFLVIIGLFLPAMEYW